MCMHTGIFFLLLLHFVSWINVGVDLLLNTCGWSLLYLNYIRWWVFPYVCRVFFVAYFDFFSRQFTDFSRHIFRTNSFNDANILTYIPNDINVSQHWHYFPLAMPSSSFAVWMCMSCDCKVHNFQMRFISKFHTRTIQLDTQLEWSHFINVFYFSHEKSNQALSTFFLLF